MTAKHKRNGTRQKVHSELRSQLADMLTLRTQGLLTQGEYEERLEQIGRALPRGGRLAERDLPTGGSRFVLSEARTGRILGEYEFHLGHEVER
jgi:hypothetical protein